METVIIPLDQKPFGLYSKKKLFQNYERLNHNERLIVAIDLVPALCIKYLLFILPID